MALAGRLTSVSAWRFFWSLSPGACSLQSRCHMPSQHTTSQLLRSAPYFPVADIEQSAAHYERVLGFRREYIAGRRRSSP